MNDGQSDQALTDGLQSIIDLQNAADNMTLCDRLQRMISSHPDMIPPYPDYTTQNTHDLREITQNFNFNLCDVLQNILDDHSRRLCQNVAQNGGVLTDRSSASSCNMHPSTDAEHSSSLSPPSGNVDAERPSTTHSEPTTGDERPSTSRVADPSVTTRANIDAAIRNGGFVNGFRVLPRPRFNGFDLRRTMNMRDIMSPDLDTYHISLHTAMDEIVSFAREMGGDASIINLVMSAPSLNSSVNAILTPGNNYDVNLFTEQIENFLQSNNRLMADDAVEIEASVAMNRQGGGRRRKLTDLALDQVIRRKKINLFCPVNKGNQLCLTICLARFLHPQLPESKMESHASIIQTNAGVH